MFKQYFGLAENPFNLTPDPKYLYLSEVHREALAHLQYGIEQRKGFVLITGEVGAGKTTICRTLLGKLPMETHTALILHPSLSELELLQAINQEFGLDAGHTSKKSLLDDLYAFLLNIRAQGHNAVLVIDECQNLSPGVLEQVRMLSNLETDKEKLLQILLIGQPELANMLSSPNLKQINDRIVLRYHMGPLNERDTQEYIAHRLMVAGSHGDIKFSSSAIRKTYRYSSGLPRKINALAERAMLITYLKGKRIINGSSTVEAIKELRGEYNRPSWAQRFTAPAFFLLSCVILILALGIFWPSLFSEIGQRFETPNVSAELAVPQPAQDAGQVIPVKNYWTIPDYGKALELLYQVPGGLKGPDLLNLHPDPGCLVLIDRPFISAVQNGYAVVLEVSDDGTKVKSADSQEIEVPSDRFRQVYKWNIILNYTREENEKICMLSDSGEDVQWYQSVLYRHGYLMIEPNGIYGIETVRGVERLQETFGLRRDGIIGPETRELLTIIGGKIS